MVEKTAGKGHVVLNNVSKCFFEDEQKILCLDQLSIEIPPGQLTVLMGPSGCGKTSMINLIAGYETPDTGSITIDGEQITGPGHDRLVVFQETALFPWMTVFNNVAFGPKAKGLPEGDIKEKTESILETVGLQDFQDKYPTQLSGGMQRRAELARALVNEPSIMILDEPFRGLDAMTRELMQEFYLKLFDETKITTLFVTHELEEAIFMADTVIILTYKPGRVRKVVKVPLERPRHFSVAATKEYMDIFNDTIEILFEEAKKAFDHDDASSLDIIQSLKRSSDDS
ncbi:ABC transporter, ATP-binding protein (cluster 10, nitrate/sulfonate/bicarbonate) [hydrothermal vent metagenome]|uniref:ABC transporter, ATP-binding protein (Cluster 10, nitrate/sulfonate/bicarbonate) n=1 Tax=hydrothermal vent metagenome TaxID=652676 RepID=A0A3B1BXG3_9ZZZZ